MAKRLFIIFVTLAVACAAMADVSIAKVYSIVKSRAPGAQYSRPTVARRGNREVWVVNATKNGQVRTITIDKHSGNVVSDTRSYRGVRRDDHRKRVVKLVPARRNDKHVPKGKAYGYWEHHQQGKDKHAKKREIKALRREEKRKHDVVKPATHKHDDNHNRRHGGG